MQCDRQRDGQDYVLTLHTRRPSFVPSYKATSHTRARARARARAHTHTHTHTHRFDIQRAWQDEDVLVLNVLHPDEELVLNATR